MRKSGFYPRLAMVNLLRNRQFYIPYLLSCSGTAAMFYIVSYLSRSQIIAGVRGAPYLQALMMLGTIVVALFSIVLMLYANSFVMKRRRRELGLYNVLGMEKRHIAHLMLWETLLCALVSLLGGIVAGLLFSKLVLLLLLYMVHLPVQFGFEISTTAIVNTLMLFGILFLLTLLFNLIRLGRSRPVELLRSENSGEREPRVKWPLVVIGLAALLGGYYISLSVKDPLSALLFFFIAVILVIIGTLCLFTTGSIAILKHLRRNKAFYYQPRHFTAVSGMLYRMKQNAVGLSNICILSTMVLVTVSTTACLYLGLDNILNQMYPTEIQVAQMQVNEEQSSTPEFLLEKARETAEETGRTITSETYCYYSIVAALYSGNSLIFDYAPTADPGDLYLMTAEDYTRLTGESVSLGPDEVLAYTSKGSLPNTIFIDDNPYQIVEHLDTFLNLSQLIYTARDQIALVVSDEKQLETILSLVEKSTVSSNLRLYLEIDGTDAEKLAYADALQQTYETAAAENGLNYPWVQSRQYNAEDFYAMYGGFLFLGIFLGILFLAATVLIIYYKQISEGYEDRRRFQIMQQVGMSEHEVRSTINTQIRMVFFLPLAMAALHIIVAFSMMRKLLMLFSLNNTALFVLCTLITLLLFSAIYALVYSITAKSYFKIVRQ